MWGRCENKLIEYEPFPYYDGTYWWLNCYSEYLEEIRKELGLIVYSE